MRILITGGSGFIGSALCKALAPHHELTGIYHKHAPPAVDIRWKRVDLRDPASLADLLRTDGPDVVVHGAGLKRGRWLRGNDERCLEVNGLVTERLGFEVARINPRVLFIYLSSVSVYGAGGTGEPFREEDPCRPAGANGVSKLYGEERLRFLFEKKVLRNALIFRLAPCYDRAWTRNLERRIMLPGRIAYVRYGSGEQKMSALARGNVIDAVSHVLRDRKSFRGFQRFNLCDIRPYTFNEVMEVVRGAGVLPRRPVISFPPPLMNFFCRRADRGFPVKSPVLQSYPAKICRDMTYDMGKLLEKGFIPVHSLEKVLLRP